MLQEVKATAFSFLNRSTTPPIRLDGLRNKVFMDRYALKNEKGEAMETVPAEMWARVAAGIADVESNDAAKKYWAEKFFDALSDFKFVPGGRILAGAGTNTQVTYYNCYVIPSPEDSRGGILDNLKVMTEIMARGGGVGVNLSSLRPRGSYIKSVNGTASGPCSWAELYSVATGDVIQQGGSRRGALMLMLDDSHPDIEEFINVKRDLKKINHANLSVSVSDKFMNAVKNNLPWNLHWGGETLKVIEARDLWNQICESAHASGEPGLVFMDRYNIESNTWYYEDIICVNPCGEQGLPAWGVCNLGALNLSAFVVSKLNEPGTFDFEKLGEVSRVAMRFLDNVVDSNLYFLPENETAQMGTRRTGLGTMGLADALIKMQVAYGSEESIQIIEKIYQTIRDNAYIASADLAKEKGSFKFYDQEKYMLGRFISRLPVSIQKQIQEHGIRNAVLLTQAPTGSTSLLSGVSSGIEPVYAFAMKRKDRIGEHTIYHPLLQEWKDAHPDHQDGQYPSYFVSANDLTPEQHVMVQSTIQHYTDSSISKTVNAPNDHTVDQVQKLYMAAYDQGCKGVTYFRDGCREGVLSHIEPQKESAPVNNVAAVLTGNDWRKRDRITKGTTFRTETPLGTMFTTITHNEKNEPIEMFMQVGKAGSDTASVTEAIGRLISLTLRLPSPIPAAERLREIADQLNGIGGGRQLGFGRNKVKSLPDAVSRVMQEFLSINEDSDPVHDFSVSDSLNDDHHHDKFTKADLCPECGDATLIYQEGCAKCHSCGFSEC